MPISTWKLGIAALGIFSLLTYAVPSFAQEEDELGTDQELTPSCVPRNIRTGRAKCSYPNGDKYEGMLVNGILSGRGVYVYANGSRYEGEFRNSLPNGRGLFIGTDDTRFEGVFRDGTLTGTQNTPGKITFTTGERYEGELEVLPLPGTPGRFTSRPHGRGVFVFEDGSGYTGQFFQGQILGTGILTRPDGSRCNGQFFNQALDARVTCQLPGGSRYQGELRGGVPHGQGTLIDANGNRTSGTFRQGKPAR